MQSRGERASAAAMNVGALSGLTPTIDLTELELAPVRDPKAKMRVFFWATIFAGAVLYLAHRAIFEWEERILEVFPRLARDRHALSHIGSALLMCALMLVAAGGGGLWGLRSAGSDLLSRNIVLVCAASAYLVACWHAGRAVFCAVFCAYAPDSYVNSGVLGVSPDTLAVCFGGLCVLPVCALFLWRARMILRLARMSYPCAACGYELAGNTTGTCPECGATISEEMRHKIASGKSDNAEHQSKSAADLLRQVRAVMQDRTRLAAFLKRADVLVTLIFLLLFVVSAFWTVGWAHHWTSSYELWGIECSDGCVRLARGDGMLFQDDTGYVREVSGEGTLGLVWMGLCHDGYFYKDVYRVPLWLTWLMLMISIYLWRRAKTATPRGPLDCIHCGYNLAGNTSGICPECGTSIPDDVKDALRRTQPEPLADASQE